MCQLCANINVRCFYVGLSSSPSNKTNCSFLVHFLLLLAAETLNVNDNMIYKGVRLVQILLFVALMWAYLPRPAIRPFVHLLVRFLLILSIETFNVNEDIVFPFVHSLAHFLLLLAIENLNVKDNIIFCKWVKLVEILTLVALMWASLFRPTIREFIAGY